MNKVVFDISMSLDGFVTGPNRRLQAEMGDGGEKLHDWAFGEDKKGVELLKKGVSSLGAMIVGRRMYDDSILYWGADGPTGPARRPTIVVTHAIPKEVPENGVYTFITEGIESALKKAQEIAGDKTVAIGGGADIAQQYIKAGLVDEIIIRLVPILFGDGLRLFEHLGDEQIQLETIEVIQSSAATHIRFRIVK